MPHEALRLQPLPQGGREVKRGSRVMLCAGQCGKQIRVGMGVAYIICGPCSKNMNSVWAKMEAKRRKSA